MLIADEGDRIRVGALATHTEIENSEIIRTYLPYLGAACSTVGSPQIRNMGTIGGSICNASPAADPLTPLVASDAIVEITGTQALFHVYSRARVSSTGALEASPQRLFTREIPLTPLHA